MSKRVLSMLLAIIIVTIAAAGYKGSNVEAAELTQASKIIAATGIMNTDDASSTSTKTGVTRAQFSQMMVNMSSYKDMVSQSTNVSLFKDVSKSYWAASYIKVAITEGWMSAYLNGSFKPSTNITLQEAVNAVVKLLGYSDTDFVGNLNSAKMSLYFSKNLDQNISKTKAQKLTKTDCENLFYNTLITTNKTGTVYGTTLGYTLNADGEIDYLALINSEMDGPIIASTTWAQSLPFLADNATYYRNSVIGNKNSIQTYDVLYYSETLKTVWAYSDKVSGTLESVAPDKLAPTEATIAGNTFSLGTQEMSYTFSTLGTVGIGDVITALLGKDGSIVGVLTDDEYTTDINGTVIATGEKISTQTANATICKYVTLVTADAREYTFEYDAEDTNGTDNTTFAEGELVSVTYSESDYKIKYCYQRYLSPIRGTISSDGTKMGNLYTLASDIEILDVQGTQYLKIYPSRIANTELFPSDILFYRYNDNGEIDQLILNNVTADLDTYGILLETTINMTANTILNSYNCIIDGTATSYSSSSELASVYNSIVRISLEDSKIDDISNLYNTAVTLIKGTKVKTSTDTLILSDSADVYYLEDGDYHLTTLAKVSDLTKYYLTAYYDKATLQGGRVRVIVARDN